MKEGKTHQKLLWQFSYFIEDIIFLVISLIYYWSELKEEWINRHLLHPSLFRSCFEFLNKLTNDSQVKMFRILFVLYASCQFYFVFLPNYTFPSVLSTYLFEGPHPYSPHLQYTLEPNKVKKPVMEYDSQKIFHQ